MASRDGALPRARQALLADAIGTVAGAGLGTSTVTAYIESGAGVAAGGRTGLASIVTAALFLLSLGFYPLVRMIGGGYVSALVKERGGPFRVFAALVHGAKLSRLVSPAKGHFRIILRPR